ncbi:MAG: phage virion morphogenesis protein [Chloroflexota bacterium]
MHLEFSIDGRKQLSRVLQGISDDIQNWQPALERMATDFYETQGDVFLSEGAAEGLARWAPLSPGYAAWKAQNYEGRPMLVLTGRLRSALTNPSGQGAIKRVEKRRLELGANVPVGRRNLALLHQRGTDRMPARPVIRISQPQRARWVRILQSYLWEEQLEDHIESEIRDAFRLSVEREP